MRNHPNEKKEPRLLRKRLTEATDPDASVLCLIKTGNATGSNLVATVHTTLSTSLSDIRVKLTGIASSAARLRGPLPNSENIDQPLVSTAVAPRGPPVNYANARDLELVTTSRLHAFDLTAPFRFVRRGGSVNISRGKEASYKLLDVLPLIPPFGLSRDPRWQCTPPFGTVVVQTKNSDRTNNDIGLREAIVVLFVAQGEFADDGHSEKVVMERLLLQQQGYGRATNVKQLSAIVHKWNANSRDFLGRTPLHEYAMEGNYAAVKYLLSLPFVRVDEVDFGGNTALHLATVTGHVDCVVSLLEGGAQLLVSNHKNQTPLHIALYCRHDGLVELYSKRLRQQQVPLSELSKYVDNIQYNPVSLFKALAPSLDQLIIDGNVDALRAMTRHYLFSNPKVLTSRRRFFNNETLLHVAARSGNEAVVKLLLDELKWLRDFAPGAGDAELANALLSESKRSPLHIAAQLGHTAVVRRLLPHMPTMCAVQDVSGLTPLMLSLMSRRIDTAQFLVDNATDVGVHCVSRRGFTALHFAAAVGSTSIVSCLLTRFGAAPDVYTTVAVVQKRRLEAGANRPMSGDRQELLRFLRSVRVKYSRSNRRSKPPLPVYERRPVTLHTPTPLQCALAAPRGSGVSVAALLLSHGAGTTFISDSYLPSVLKSMLSAKQWDLAAAVARLMGASAAVDASLLGYFVQNIKQSSGQETVRWLVERKVGLESGMSAALQACAAADDVHTMRYLFDSVSSVNSAAIDAALLVAIRNRNSNAVGELVRRGASLTNVEEHKAPLVIAASIGCEPVVRSLASLPVVATFDAVTALLTLLRACPRSISDRKDAVACAASWNAMGVTLVRKVMLQDSHIHPVELIHLAASKKLFGVAAEIAERLAAHPSDARVAIIKSAPAAPQRPSVTVTPKISSKEKKKRQDRQLKKQRKPLYKPLLSFDRFVYTAPSSAVLEHRAKYRDAFSYFAECGLLNHIETLMLDLRLSPWRSGDLRGWNAADYAIENGHYQVAVALVAGGLLPQKNHIAVASSKLGMLNAACKLACNRVKRHSEQGAAVSLRVLLESMAELGYVEPLCDLLRQLCCVLKQATLHGVPWLMSVVRSAARFHQAVILKRLVPDFLPSLASPISDGDEELLVAAIASEAPAVVVDHLLAFGAPVHLPSPLSKSTIRLLKRATESTFTQSQKIIAVVVAAALGQIDNCRKLIACAGSPTQLAADVVQEPLRVALSAARHRHGLSDATHVDNIVEALLGTANVKVSIEALRIATKKRLHQTVALIFDRVGYELLVDDLSTTTSFSGSIVGESLMSSAMEVDDLLPNAVSELANEQQLGDDSLVRRLLSDLKKLSKETSSSLLFSAALRNGHVTTCAMLALLGFTPSAHHIEGPRLEHKGRQRRSTCRGICVSSRAGKGRPTKVLQHAATLADPLPLNVLLKAHQRMRQALGGKQQAEEILGFALDMNHLVATAVATRRWSSVEMLQQFAAEDEEFRPLVACTTIVQAMLFDSFRQLRRSSATAQLLSSVVGEPSQQNTRMFLPADVWQLLSESGPLSSEVIFTRNLRKCFLFEAEGLVVTRITPISLAVLLGDEGLALQLLSHGASVACQHSEVSKLITSRSTRKAIFTNARGRWLPSPLPQRAAGSSTQIQRRATLVERVSANQPKKTPVGGGSLLRFSDGTVCCRVSVCMMAVHALHNAAQRLPTSTNSLEVERREHLLIALIQRGGLTRDLLNPIAIIASKLRRWTLLTSVIEEGLRVSRLHNDTDRFFKCLSNDEVPAFLQFAVGTHRHVLHAACRTAARDVLLLIARHSHRADVEGCLDARGRTPLYHAVFNPTSDALETLAALQAPCHAVCDVARQQSPLTVAARIGHTAAVASLLKYGGLHHSDMQGNTALHFAASSGKQEVVELLLSAQADATVKNDAGLTPAMLAAQGGFDHIALPMAQHFSRLASFVTPTTTLLHCAVIGGCQRLAEYLVRTYDSLGVFQEDATGHTPVYLAFAFGRGAILRMMMTELQHRTESPAFAVDEQILSCSSELSRYGWLAATLRTGESLLAESAKRAKFSVAPWELVCSTPLRPIRSEPSRLLWSAKNGCAVSVRVLADLNVCDDCFALHEAAKRGALDVLQLLVALKMSDANSRDPRGFLAVDHAIRGRHEACAVFLVQNMRLTVDVLYQSLSLSGSSLLHWIASSGTHKVLSVALPKLLQGVSHAVAAHPGKTSSIGNALGTISVNTTAADALSSDMHAAETTLKCLMTPDSEGRTPFELAVLFGSAATTLRIAQAIQQLAIASSSEATITLPSSLFELRPNLSPGVRAVLYDFFDVHEVFTQSVFTEVDGGRRKSEHVQAKSTSLPGGDASERLLFGDVRLLGIQELRRDAFCNPKLDTVYTVDHERQVLKHITQVMDLPFRLKFRPEGIRSLPGCEQAAILQRLATSSLLGKYVHLLPKSASIGTLELEAVTTRADAGFVLQGTTAVERFCVSKHVVHLADVQKQLDKENFSECLVGLTKTQTMLKSIAKRLRALPHPMLKGITLRLDWNGLKMSRTEEPPLGDAPAAADSAEALFYVATETVHYVNSQLLPVLESELCDASIADALAGCDEVELQTVIVSNAPFQAIVLRCFESLDHIPDARLAPFTQGTDLVIPFLTATCTSHPLLSRSRGGCIVNSKLCDHVAVSVSLLHKVVQRDIVLLEVHKLRDRFATSVSGILASARPANQSSTIKFKLETDGDVDISDLPLHLLSELLDSTAAVLRRIVAPVVARLRKPQTWKSLTSSYIVAQSVTQSLSSVTVVFSAKRQIAARRSGSKLLLCISRTLAPCASEIESSVRMDTVDIELEKLKEQLPVTVADMSQRLSTYLPTTTLVVDLPSLSYLPGDDDVLSALAVLNYERSAVVLQEIIRGVSVGWDTKVGSVIRRHIRQLSLTLQRGGGHATVSLLPNGNLVLHYPLQCVEQSRGKPHAISAWAVPSSQQIASLTLMQLASKDDELKSIIDLNKGFACWCTASGVHTRQVVSGDVRSHFFITVRNVLNMPAKQDLNETFEFSSNRSLSSLRVQPSSKRKAPLTSLVAPTSSYKVQFCAPSTGPTLLLSVRLHGSHIMNSPLRIRVRPGACSLSHTECLSRFNAIVVSTSTCIEYQLKDSNGNKLAHTPKDLTIDGPAPGNPDRVRITSYTSTVPGVIRIHVIVDAPGKEVTVPIRFQLGGDQFVTTYCAEVVSQEMFEQLLAIKRGAVVPAGTVNPAEVKKIRDRVGLYFRAKIRENESAKRRRDCRVLGGVRHRIFPSKKK